MKKIIVTGTNGTGKSHFARRLAAVRPEIPVVSYDALKLISGWQQRSRAEIEVALAIEVGKSAWILEGGPSLLPQALGQADALVWLDPPEYVRTYRLALRPWKSLGKTRPELPDGNVDWPIQQYKFALRSLHRGPILRNSISTVFDAANGVEKRRCRNETDRAAFIAEWAASPD